MLPLRLLRCSSKFKINRLTLSSHCLSYHKLWFLLRLHLDLLFYMLLSIFLKILNNSHLDKGIPPQMRCSTKWCHARHINTNILHDLSEKHTKRDMILLHFRVESFFEILHSVIKYDFWQIHLLTYHHLVHAKSILLVNIVSEPQSWHSHVEQKAIDESTHVG